MALLILLGWHITNAQNIIYDNTGKGTFLRGDTAYMLTPILTGINNMKQVSVRTVMKDAISIDTVRRVLPMNSLWALLFNSAQTDIIQRTLPEPYFDGHVVKVVSTLIGTKTKPFMPNWFLIIGFPLLFLIGRYIDITDRSSYYKKRESLLVITLGGLLITFFFWIIDMIFLAVVLNRVMILYLYSIPWFYHISVAITAFIITMIGIYVGYQMRKKKRPLERNARMTFIDSDELE